MAGSYIQNIVFQQTNYLRLPNQSRWNIPWLTWVRWLIQSPYTFSLDFMFQLTSAFLRLLIWSTLIPVFELRQQAIKTSILPLHILHFTLSPQYHLNLPQYIDRTRCILRMRGDIQWRVVQMGTSRVWSASGSVFSIWYNPFPGMILKYIWSVKSNKMKDISMYCVCKMSADGYLWANHSFVT